MYQVKLKNKMQTA
uniref:Uncharacterized protein n=1 Tax=Rhizophora mucronata TaxID=61149 RepID=A0A2P2PQF9_RHIMU